jgi:hypothetical protein
LGTAILNGSSDTPYIDNVSLIMSLIELASELIGHSGLSIVIEKAIKVFFDELKPLEEKIDRLIFGYFKDGQAFLEQALIADNDDTKKKHLHNAYISFTKAAHRLEGLESAQAQFMAGTCLYMCANKNGANLCFIKVVEICDVLLTG